MMNTRREFFVRGSAMLAGLSFLPRSLSALTAIRRAAGLYFDDSDLPRLRRNFFENDLFVSLRNRLEEIDRNAVRTFLRDEVRHNDQLYDIVRVSNAMEDMAFYHVMSGDGDAAELAIEATETLMKFEKWDYFLEGGQRPMGLQRSPSSTMATAVASEWLRPVISDEDRRRWIRNMAEKGVEPAYTSLYGMRYPQRVVGWSIDPESTYLEHRPDDAGWDLSRWPIILDSTNLKAVPAMAVAVGAIVYLDVFGEDERTERWLEQAEYSIRSFDQLFEADGSYPEGVMYGNYTAISLAKAKAPLSRRLGRDLYDVINWPGFKNFLVEMSMPTHEDVGTIVNFGDNWRGGSSALAFWVARHERDPAAQWFGETLSPEQDRWSLIFYDPALQSRPPEPGPRLWRSDLDWIVARTGYGVEDLVVAMRSGPPGNHEHADRNSIIVKYAGEQLVADPERTPYTFTDPSWLLRLTEGHSALLIDGQGHQYHDGSEGTNASDAHAEIIDHELANGYMNWASDATQAYQIVMPDVESVVRRVVVAHEIPAVIVIDRVQKSQNPSNIEARFFAYNGDGNAQTSADDAGFTIRRAHASVRGMAFSRQSFAFGSERLPIPEETARLHPYTVVRTGEESLSPSLITVLLLSTADERVPMASIIPDGDDAAVIEIASGRGSFRCRVDVSDSVPTARVM